MKQEMVEIRMKPGCGRMLIGRAWRMPDGTLSETRPKNAADSLETEERWLEARGVDESGAPTDGPTATVPMDLVKRFLNKEGKPSRVIDGYLMVKSAGGTVQDISGASSDTSPSFSPGLKPGVYDDSTFEIVRVIRQ